MSGGDSLPPAPQVVGVCEHVSARSAVCLLSTTYLPCFVLMLSVIVFVPQQRLCLNSTPAEWAAYETARPSLRPGSTSSAAAALFPEQPSFPFPRSPKTGASAANRGIKSYSASYLSYEWL